MGRILIGIKLFFVAALSGVLLYFVNSMTKPVIEANQIARATEMYSNIFPEMDSFETTAVSGSAVSSVVSIYDKAGESIGAIYSASMNNDYGSITLLVGIGADGEVVNLEYSYMNQTPTYAAKVQTDAFKSKFIGRVSGDSLTDVDVKVGATYSGTTTRDLVQAILDYHEGVN